MAGDGATLELSERTESAGVVLIVEDEDVLRDLLVSLLEPAGYRLLTATDVREALSHLSAEKPHVVLTDKNLPDGDGLRIIREGRLLAPDAAFLLMTGDPSLDSAIEALELGACSYLPKPFPGFHEVTERIAAARARQRALELERLLVRERERRLERLVDGLLRPLAAMHADLTHRFERPASPAEDPLQLAMLAELAATVEAQVEELAVPPEVKLAPESD